MRSVKQSGITTMQHKISMSFCLTNLPLILTKKYALFACKTKIITINKTYLTQKCVNDFGNACNYEVKKTRSYFKI